MMRSPHLKGENSGEVVTILVILVALAALAYGTWWGIGKAADYMATKVPDSFETKVFGTLGGKQPGWGDRPATDEQKRAQQIFERFLKDKSSTLRDLDYKMYFIRQADPNAFAVPGGAIGVTDGLLKLVQSEIGLATVIGHEFGHLQHRHSLRHMGRSLLIGAAIMIIMGGDTGFIMNMALSLADMSHSRDQEREADEYGLRLVHRVFGTTEGSLEFFTRLEDDPKTSSGSALLSMLSTHPYTPDRIEHLRRLAKELESTSPPAPAGKAPAQKAPSGKKARKK